MKKIKFVEKLEICKFGSVHFLYLIHPKKLRNRQEKVQSFHEVLSYRLLWYLLTAIISGVFRCLNSRTGGSAKYPSYFYNVLEHNSKQTRILDAAINPLFICLNPLVSYNYYNIYKLSYNFYNRSRSYNWERYFSFPSSIHNCIPSVRSD
jgi:hypothetical protein